MSIDTNILLPAVEAKNADHVKAAAFLESLTARDDVAISELALIELYVLLRNPAVRAGRSSLSFSKLGGMGSSAPFPG